MEVTGALAYGAESMSGRLRRVAVRPPHPAALARWRAFGWRSAPDPAAASAEHEAFCAVLEQAGAEVVACPPDETNPDAIYVYDPVLVSAHGAIVLRPGKEARHEEPKSLEEALAAAGVPTAARLEAPATAEGGDTLWLDARTLLVGQGYRTNPAGVEALRTALPEVEVIGLDLPHFRGPGEVLHLMSLLSPLDRDLAVAYLPLMPVRLVTLLAERGVSIVEVPDEEFDSMGANVLALAPRVVLALDGNPQTRRRMERAGVEVLVYRGKEISRKGDGGPTCLTRPILRDPA